MTTGRNALARCCLLAVAYALLACGGQTGVISVSLTTAPGSTLLDSVQTLRLTITNPPSVQTAERTGDGFEIAVELDATGEATRLSIDGLDAAGTLIATGASPMFPVGAVDGAIVIYMAPPHSIGVAPRSIEPARSELAVGTLPYGVILVGGRDASGGASDSVVIYNAYNHSLLSGLPLPAPRAGIALAIGAANHAYLFGGRDGTGAVTDSMWRFDTSVAPAGAYLDYGAKAGFARADELMVPIGGERFLVTGTPPAEVSGLDGTMVASDTPTLPPAGTTLVASDGVQTTIFAGADGVTRFRTGTFTMLPIAAATRAGASVVEVPGGKAAVVCGTNEAVRIDAATGDAEVVAGVPAQVKTGCAVAVTPRHLVIAGGTTAGGIDPTVEVYDAATFALIATAELVVPRTNAIAIALPTEQVLIAGGVDAAGAPVGIIELYTPPAN